MTETTAIMICGQTNPADTYQTEFDALARAIGERLSGFNLSSGFLGSPEQSVRSGVETLVEQGAARVICVPGMLPTTNLDKNDIAAEIEKISVGHPAVSFAYSRDLAIDGKMLAVARDCIEACEAEALVKTKREETLLMVVGAGSTDAEPNANVAKVARMLWEGMGFGWAEVSYADETFPSVNVGLNHAVKLGFKSILVFPYFLFAEKTLDDIYHQADLAAKSNPDINIQKVSHLSNHSQLIDCFVDRILEAINGSNSMNCMKCAYREQLTGHHHHEHEHDHAHTHAHEDRPGHRHDHDHPHGGHEHAPSPSKND